MPFPYDIVLSVWRIAGGQCMCRIRIHTHAGRCPQPLILGMRGNDKTGGWEPHRIAASELDNLDNCEILCMSCYRAVRGEVGGI